MVQSRFKQTSTCFTRYVCNLHISSQHTGVLKRSQLKIAGMFSTKSTVEVFTCDSQKVIITVHRLDGPVFR